MLALVCPPFRIVVGRGFLLLSGKRGGAVLLCPKSGLAAVMTGPTQLREHAARDFHPAGVLNSTGFLLACWQPV